MEAGDIDPDLRAIVDTVAEPTRDIKDIRRFCLDLKNALGATPLGTEDPDIAVTLSVVSEEPTMAEVAQSVREFREALIHYGLGKEPE